MEVEPKMRKRRRRKTTDLLYVYFGGHIRLVLA